MLLCKVREKYHMVNYNGWGKEVESFIADSLGKT
jgi:hypothetical protein